MKVHDSCKCGAVFNARGFATSVVQAWAAWLNAHARCRGDNKIIDVEVD